MTPASGNEPLTVLCFSHLRWGFVYQRPQHLLTRLQKVAPVLFIEEPRYDERTTAELHSEMQPDGIEVLTPLLPKSANAVEEQRRLLDELLAERSIDQYLAWYYTPMALGFSRHLQPEVTVYDCMDELSMFAGAPPELLALEAELFGRADLVFVGGRSLYERKRKLHRDTHLFPSSIDRAHFAVARRQMEEPEDQRSIPHPRIGFFGVLDERLDRELVREVAALEPSWHFIFLGPVVKIAPESLPQGPNLHYLGQKSYAELPRYLASWDVAMLPFARNDSTRFISPTKTPEYLAAGRPVVSTAIPDVVEPYGNKGLALIADTAEEFRTAIRALMEDRPANWLHRVDEYLRDLSWDRTFEEMWRLIERRRNEAKTVSSAETTERGEVAHV